MITGFHRTERLADSLGFRYVSYYVRKRPEDSEAA